MEDEKKKRKNKKKKSKQSKPTGDVIPGAGESTNSYQNHAIEQNHHNQVLETADAQNGAVKSGVDLDTRRTNGAESSVLAEAEKSFGMDREASLEEAVKKLQKEHDTHIQKEASLEERISKLLNENKMLKQEEASLEVTNKKLQKEYDTHLHKEASFEEMITKLRNENTMHIQKEASLEETSKQLQKENDIHVQREASLEMRCLQLQSEKDSWLQKEAGFEAKINQLVSLEEKMKQLERERDSWIQNEKSTKETIASLNGDNAKLRTQVMELEESRNYLLQENQRMTLSVSEMQSQIQNLEKIIALASTSTVTTMHVSGSDDMNLQLKAARELVEKLVAENTELVEKVNNLYVELDKRGVTAELSPDVRSKLSAGTSETIYVADPISEFRESTSASSERTIFPDKALIKDARNGGNDVAVSMSEFIETATLSGKRMESLEDVAIKDEREEGEYTYSKDATVISNSPDTIDSEEIVQIPLDENEVGDPPGPELSNEDQKTEVPLTDAPIIGAPFRLISFFARYVSGADLVNKSSVN